MRGARRPAPPTTVASSRHASPAWMAGLTLVIAALLVYANALSNPFVFDDVEAIVTNPNITSLTPITRAMSAPAQSAVAGRPLVALSLALNHAWGRLSPWGYHLWNLGVHVLCAWLLFAIVRHTLSWMPSSASPHVTSAPRLATYATPLALATAGLWLVHPLQTELVNYVVQRSESMMALCYLAALYGSLRVMTGGHVAWTAVAVVAAAAGVACKEAMATAPLAILLVDAVFVSGSPLRALKARPMLYVGLAASWLLLAWLIADGPRWRSAGFSTGISPWTYLLRQAEMIVTYLKLAVWPQPLVLDYGWTRAVSFGDAWLPFLAVAALGGATVLLLWRWPLIGFFGAWFFITLAPSSSIVPILTEVGAERRMYLPLAALVSLAVCGGWWLVTTRTTSSATVRRAAIGAAVAVAWLLGGLSARRNLDYRDDVALWQGVAKARPHGRAFYNLGNALRDRGRTAEALAEYRRAADVEWPHAHYALGFEMQKAGRHEDAVRELRQFVAMAPNDVEVPGTYVMLGGVLAKLGRLAESLDAYKTSLNMRPSNASALGGTADVLLDLNRFGEAAVAYEAYLKQVPTSGAAWGNLGKALVGADRAADAERAFARAVQLMPNDAPQRTNHGHALASVGRLQEAAAEYRVALQLAPTSVDTLGGLGSVLAALGQREEARRVFDQALRLEPANAQLQQDIAAAFGSAPRAP